jgi:hypothetical protein
MSVVGISVDYAATGTGHMDRAPSRVCLARDGVVVLDILVAVPDLVDAMEAYTSIATETLREATTTLEDTIATVHSTLIAIGAVGAVGQSGPQGPTGAVGAAGQSGPQGPQGPSNSVVLVGASMHRTVRVLGLVHGTHFNRIVDLVERTRTWNMRFGHWNYYSLQKIAYVCGIEVKQSALDRALCAVSVSDALATESAVADVKMQLQTKQYARQFPAEITAKPETTVCTHAYNTELCFCGQPTLSDRRAKAAQPRIAAS